MIVLIIVSGCDYPHTKEELRKIRDGEILPPQVYLIDGEQLIKTKEKILQGDRKLKPAFKSLIKKAKASLKSGPFSVMDKKMAPPSGDKHDYMSIYQTYWRNPGTPDGLPYVYIGDYNPECEEYDMFRLRDMCYSVYYLSFAYFITGREKYANYAVILIKVWFLDEETKMNPHLEYAQSVPGVYEGKRWGIHDAWPFILFLDEVGLLEGSQSLTEEDRTALQSWFSEYLDWQVFYFLIVTKQV